MYQAVEGEPIEPLLHTETVRSWRVGSDLHIEVADMATNEDFLCVLDTLGLRGRADFEVSYIPETGTEIYSLALVSEAPPVEIPTPRETGGRRSRANRILELALIEQYNQDTLIRSVSALLTLLTAVR